MIRTFSLQSGSNGNAIYVEADGTRLLFDAGISGRQIGLRLAERGVNVRELDAVVISHDHTDHIRGAGPCQRVFKLPLYCTSGTRAVMGRKWNKLRAVTVFGAGASFEVGAVRVHTVRTPHDAEDAVAFVVEACNRRLGIFTDLGQPFLELAGLLGTLDAVYLESNYDPGLLAGGPYPAQLKARISGGKGHLSNRQSADLLRCADKTRLQWAALAHLSEHNNTPDVALRTHHDRGANGAYPLHVAGRYAASPTWRIE